MPKTMWDLDLSQPLFHFYFYGEKNMSRYSLQSSLKTWINFSLNSQDLLARDGPDLELKNEKKFF